MNPEERVKQLIEEARLTDEEIINVLSKTNPDIKVDWITPSLMTDFKDLLQTQIQKCYQCGDIALIDENQDVPVNDYEQKWIRAYGNEEISMRDKKDAYEESQEEMIKQGFKKVIPIAQVLKELQNVPSKPYNPICPKEQ
jgi:hypothetical protein